MSAQYIGATIPLLAAIMAAAFMNRPTADRLYLMAIAALMSAAAYYA